MLRTWDDGTSGDLGLKPPAVKTPVLIVMAQGMRTSLRDEYSLTYATAGAQIESSLLLPFSEQYDLLIVVFVCADVCDVVGVYPNRIIPSNVTR